MNEIRVNKAKLLDILRENRDKHHQIVEEAQVGFRKAAIERLDAMLEDAKNGRRIELNLGLRVPEDHTAEYDTVIGMLELDINEHVDLEFHEYRQYVEDDWGWKQQFTTTNAFYSATAARMI